MADPLTPADLAKLLTFVQIAQAFVSQEAPAMCEKLEALLRPAQPEKES
jgi:hypothetical protein